MFKAVKYGPSNTTVQSRDESPLPHSKVRELGHVSRAMVTIIICGLLFTVISGYIGPDPREKCFEAVWECWRQ